MATRGKSTRRTGHRTNQPKTIDLKAESVEENVSEKTTETKVSGDATPTNQPDTKAAATSRSVPNIKSSKPRESPSAASTTQTADKPDTKAKEAAKSTGATAPTEKSVGADKKPAPASDGKSNSSTTAVSKEPPAGSSNSSTPASRGTSFGALAASALLGGVVTAGGLGIIGQSDGANSIPVIGSLYAAPQKSDTGEITARLTEKYTELSAKLDELSASTTNSASEKITELAGQVETLKSGFDEQVASLSSRLSEVSEDSGVSSESVSAQIDALKQSISKLGEDGASKLEEQLSNLETAQSLLATEFKRFAEDMNPVDGSVVDELTSRLSELSAGFEQLKTEQLGRLESFKEQILGLNEKINTEILDEFGAVKIAAENVKAGQKVARSVAVSSLQSAITNNAPYLSALSSVETLIGPSDATKRLRQLAETENVPNLATLKSGFSKIAANLSAPDAEIPEDGGLMAKFVSSAKSLVSVRPSGPIDGSSSVAIVSRIEAGLNAGKLVEAAGEWKSLPDASQQAGAQWFKGLQLRLETDSLLKSVLDTATQSVEQG